METDSSRRNFLVAGLAVPVAAMATPAPQTPAAQAPRPASPGAAAARYRTLGKTGLKVSTLGYGCMITSDSSVISRAVDLGVTYFDTARGYQSGNNERMVGAALKGSRNKIVLSSKSEAKTAAAAMAELETSLKELATDHLDIWYMHSRDTVAAIPDELVTVWQNARQQGKILHIGISTHKPNAIVDRVLEVGKFEVVLSTYSFAVGTANDPAYKRFGDAGIGMVAMKVMAPAARARKPEGPVAALKWVLRDTRIATAIPAGRHRRGHSPLLLPHVRPVQRPVPQGRAGSRDPPLSGLRRFLRAVRPRPGPLPRPARRGAQRALRGLCLLPGALPQRRPRRPAPHARAEPVRLVPILFTLRQVGQTIALRGLSSSRAR